MLKIVCYPKPVAGTSQDWIGSTTLPATDIHYHLELLYNDAVVGTGTILIEVEMSFSLS